MNARDRITPPLMEWYRRRQRDLPWRRTRDPYPVWVSEVMLQQTQVATVIPYFERWMARFPDLASLAGADENAVIKAWEGLGYYARVRNLHRAAREVVERFGGVVPDDPDTFRELPGVGEYICAAVQSIAFGHPLAVVDGNVKRVLARVFAIDAPVNRASTHREFRDRARELLDPSDPSTFNQAMMELGALVCRPSSPECPACPASPQCRARLKQRQSDFPVRAPSKPVPTRRVAVGVIEHNGRMLIVRRPQDGLLGGLWEFPGGKIEEGESAEDAVRREIMEEVGMEVEVTSFVTRVRHAYSHFKVELDVFRCRPRGTPAVSLSGPTDHRWIVHEEIADYAFPRANHKFIPTLSEK
jgi:A/G-specific adenine glycosylase